RTHIEFVVIRATPVIEVVRSRRATSIFDDYFVREQEGGRTVVKLHEQHVSFQVVDLAQNFRFFTEPRTALVVAYGSQQPAMPPPHRLRIANRHRHFPTLRAGTLSGSLPPPI